MDHQIGPLPSTLPILLLALSNGSLIDTNVPLTFFCLLPLVTPILSLFFLQHLQHANRDTATMTSTIAPHVTHQCTTHTIASHNHQTPKPNHKYVLDLLVIGDELGLDNGVRFPRWCK